LCGEALQQATLVGELLLRPGRGNRGHVGVCRGNLIHGLGSLAVAAASVPPRRDAGTMPSRPPHGSYPALGGSNGNARRGPAANKLEVERGAGSGELAVPQV